MKDKIHEIPFERTWCDYLTPCPYKKDIMVGEYDCYICKDHVGFSMEKEDEQFEPCSMKRYCVVSKGIVKCKHDV
jgi:hypothetical protein